LLKITEETMIWIDMLGKFSRRIRNILGEHLLSIFASDNPLLTYEKYNVAIIVSRELSDDEKKKIYREALDVSSEYNFLLMPKIIVKGSPEEIEYVQAFTSITPSEWLSALEEFKRKLQYWEIILSIIASNNPWLGYENYNVIVIVSRELSDDEKKKIYREALDVSSGFDFTIVPKIIVKGSPDEKRYEILAKIGLKIL